MPIERSDNLYDSNGQYVRSQQANQGQVQQARQGGIQPVLNGTALNFEKMHQQISQKTQQEEEQARQEAETRRVEANVADKFFSFLGDAAKTAFNAGGAQDYFRKVSNEGKDINPASIGAMALTLPGSMIGSPVLAAEEFYAGLTGRDIDSMDENGQILATPLDATRRLGYLGDATINSLGMGFGPEARVLGLAGRGIASTGGKLGQAVAKAMPAGGRGLIADAGMKAGSATARTAGYVGQVVNDAVEEGVEEGVQTYFEAMKEGDPITSETFAEALNSAKWGAIGGTIMSGVGGGIHYAMDMKDIAKGDASFISNKNAEEETGLDQYDAFSGGVPFNDRTVLPTIQSYREKQLKEETKLNHSMTLKAAQPGSNIGIDEGWVGIRSFQNMWANGNRSTQDELCKMFDMDRDQLEFLMYKPESAFTQQDYDRLNAALANGRRENRWSVRRDPGTAQSTIHDIFVTRVTPGATIRLHQLACQLGNGDLDGDLKTLFKSVDSLIPSQLFMNLGGTGTEFGFDYLPDLSTAEARRLLRKKLVDVFVSHGYDQSKANSFATLISNAAQNAKIDGEYTRAKVQTNEKGEKEKHLYKYSSRKGFSEAIQKLANDAYKGALPQDRTGKDITGEERDLATKKMSDVIASVMDSMQETVRDEEVMTATFKKYFTVLDESIIDEAKKITGEIDDPLALQRRTTPGETDAKAFNVMVGELGAFLGLRAGTTKSGSFRLGAGTSKYPVANKVEMLRMTDEVVSNLGRDGIETAMIAILKLTAKGEHINENILSYFNDTLALRFIDSLNTRNSQSKLGTSFSMTVDEVLDMYCDIERKLADKFNSAIEKASLQGYVQPIGASTKKKYDPKTDRNAAIASMIKVIGPFPIDSIFHISEDDILSGESIYSVLDEISRENGVVSFLQDVDNETAQLLKSMARIKHNQGIRAEEAYEAIVKNLPDLSREDVKSNRNYVTATWTAETALHICDPAALEKAGLTEATRISESEYGDLVYRKGADGKKNAATIVSLEYKYGDMKKAVDNFRKTGDSAELALAIQDANSWRTGDPLSEEIFSEVLHVSKDGKPDPRTNLLDFLLNKDVDYSAKQEQFSELLKATNRQDDSLLSLAVLTEMNSIDMSNINSRVIDSENSMRNALKSYSKNCEKDANEFIKMLEDATKDRRDQMMNTLHTYVVDRAYELNLDIYASMFFDASTDFMHNQEKGTSITSAIINYQQIEISQKGRPSAMINDMQEAGTGTMSLKDLMSNKILMMDLIFKGEKFYVHTGTAMEEVGLEFFLPNKKREVERKDGSIDWIDLRALLKNHPEFIRLIEPHKLGVTLNRNEEGGVNQTGFEATKKGELVNDFSKYVDDDVTFDGKRKHQVEKITNMLLADTEFTMLVGASDLGINKYGLVNIEKVKQRVRQFSELIYDCLGNDNSQIKRKNEIASKLLTDSIGNVRRDLLEKSRQRGDLVRAIPRGLFSGDSIQFSVETLCMNIAYKRAGEALQKDKNGKLIVPEKVKEMYEKVFKQKLGDIDTADQYIKVLKQIEFSIGESFEAITTGDGDQVVADLNNAILAMVGTDKLKQTAFYMLKNSHNEIDKVVGKFAEDQFNELVNETYNEIDARLNKESEFLTAKDIETIVKNPKNRKNKAKVLAKAKAILDNPRFIDKDFKYEDLEEAFNKAMKIAEKDSYNEDSLRKALEEWRISVDNVVVRSCMNKLNNDAGATLNLDFVSDTLLVSDAFSNLVDKLTEKLKPSDYNMQKDSGFVVPRLNLTSQAQTYVATLASRYSREGRIPIGTSSNGIIEVDAEGLAIVPHNQSCNAPDPEPELWEDIYKSKIQNLSSRVSMMYKRPEDDEFKYGTVTMFAGEFDFPKGTQVILHDGKSCTCPFCSKHYGLSENKFTKGFIQPLYSYFTLITYAQESLNLKLKKTLDLLGSIVPNRAYVSKMQNKQDLKRDISKPSDLNTIREECFELRNASADVLHNRYMDIIEDYGSIDDLKGLDLMGMAQMCSSVFKATGLNGEISYISLYEIHDDDMIKQVLEPLGGGFASLECVPVSYNLINERIKATVRERYYNNPNWTDKEISELAWKCVSEWRDFGTSIGSAEYAASKIPMYNSASLINIIPEGHPTAEQLWQNEDLDKLTYEHDYTNIDYKNLNEDSSLFKTNQEIFGDDAGFIVTKVVQGKNWESSKNSSTNPGSWGKIETLNSDNNFYHGRKSAVICDPRDLKGFDSAKNKSKFLVEHFPGFEYVIVTKTSNVDVPRNTLTLKDEYSDLDFEIIDIAREARIAKLPERSAQRMKHFNREDVVVVVHDLNNVHGLGDAPYLLSQEAARLFYNENETDIVVSTEFLTKHQTPTLVDRKSLLETIKGIMSQDASGNRSFSNIIWPKVDGVKQENMEKIVGDWFESVLNSNPDADSNNIWDERGFMKSGARLNRPIALIKQPTGLAYGEGPEYIYMPAFVQGEVPNEIEKVCDFKYDPIKDAFVFKQYTSFSGLSDGEIRKLVQDMTPNKGLGSVADAEQQSLFPKLIGSMSNIPMMIDNQNTRLGRLSGRVEALAKSNLYIAAKFEHACIPYMPDGSLNPALNIGTAVGQITEEQINEMFFEYNGGINSPLWKDVALGRTKLFKDGYDLANTFVQKIANSCTLEGVYGLNIADVLSPFGADAKLGSGQNPNFYYKHNIPERIPGVFRDVRFAEMADFFNILNPKLVTSPTRPNEALEGTYLNEDGLILVNMDGKPVYLLGEYTYIKTMKDQTEIGKVSTGTSLSVQQRNARGLMFGTNKEDRNILVKSILADSGASDFYTVSEEDQDINKRRRESMAVAMAPAKKSMIDSVKMHDNASISYRVDGVYGKRRTFDGLRVKLRDIDGNIIQPYEIETNEECLNALKEFRSVCSTSDSLCTASMQTFMNIVKLQYGWTYSETDANIEIPLDFVRLVPSIIENNLSESVDIPSFLKGGKVFENTRNSDRIAFAIAPRYVVQSIINTCPRVKEIYGSEYNLFKNMQAEQENTYRSINAVKTVNQGQAGVKAIARYKELTELDEYIRTTWGEDIPDSSMYYARGSNAIAESKRAFMYGLMPDVDKAAIDDVIQRSQETVQRAEKMNQKLSKTHSQNQVSFGSSEKDTAVFVKNKKKNIGQKLLDGQVGLVQTMAVSDPGVAIGSLYEGATRGKMMDFLMWLDWGPWGKNNRTMTSEESLDIIDAVSNDPKVIQLVKAIREVSHKGELDSFLANLRSNPDVSIEELFDSLYNDTRWYGKVRDKIFKVTSMDHVFVPQQIRQLLKYFDAYVTDGNYQDMIAVNEDGRSVMEMALANDPYQFFVDCLAKDSAVQMEMLRAFNSSNNISMGQDNAYSLIMGEITKRSSAANFINMLISSPFIKYSSNIAGSFINPFVPLSTLSYVVNDALSQTDMLKDTNFLRVQRYPNIKAALVADAVRIPFVALAAIILSLGLIEPPDDDAKKGNYKEYLFCGRRIEFDYVLTDLLGPLMPYACFMRSCRDGNPRIDLLVGGIADVVSRNPLLKAGEIIETIMSPDLLAEDMAMDMDTYAKAFGGQPQPTDYLEAKVAAPLLTYLGRLITPTVIKNIGSAYKYERSYKKVWDPSVEDIDVNRGILGDTNSVSYSEAVLRRITRDNPVLGTMMNFLTGADTSWNAATSFFARHEMPPVVIDDPTQREIREALAINVYDEKTKKWYPKPEEERQQIAANIIATLQAYDNMEDLYAQGFIMDGFTRRYVGDVIWQIINGLQTDYYRWANSSEGDNYVLGNGDFQAGAAIKQQAYEETQQQVEYWKNLFENKLNSEPMRRGIQQYMRENTEWFKDDNGEWYASGFPRGMNPFSLDYLGIKFAPGTIESAEGTMGYTEDWATPSYVTGLSTGQRALVPIVDEPEPVITLDELGEQHDELVKALEEAKSSSSSGGSGSVKGYGGRSGGGGGGGGGSKTIYSRPSNVNATSARVSTGARPYDSKFDYLRPGFETKGSREASRRSDF